MPDDLLCASDFEQLSPLLARVFGWHFPHTRWSDLQRGIAASASALGFDSTAACLQWLLSRTALEQREMDVLAQHFTVGETYFLREIAHFEVLTRDILPELERRSAGGTKRLRIWSAACCSGEEPYSIAIWLHRHVPALAQWQVEIVGSDINPESLRRARAGVFSPWSFRDAPAWLARDYFRTLPDGSFELAPAIRQMVQIVPFNLAQGQPQLGSTPFDVIFCRNVLMYFTPEQGRCVLERLFRMQPDGGWLLTGSSELMHLSASSYTACRANGIIAYRKTPPAPAPVVESPPVVPENFQPPAFRCQPPSARLAGLLPAEDDQEITALELANRGQLVEALAQCEASLRRDKTSAVNHFLHGLVLKELHHTDPAGQAFARALFLDPALVMAHLAAGYLARDRGRWRASRKHFENALEQLCLLNPEEIVPESGGLSARQCMDIVRAMGLCEVAQ